MSNLLDLAIKYGTDKAGPEHNYIPFYESTLPKSPKKILEIGVKQGASMRVWQEYFPDSKLHGMDLFMENEPPDDVNAKWWKGHQSDYYLLEQLRRENFDIIIDDGSHNSRDQMMTFFGLFAAGMHYYIEDLQCCSEEFYRQGLPELFTANNTFTAGTEEMNADSNAILFDRNSPIMLIKCS